MTSVELDRLLVGPPFAGLDAEFAALLERMAGGSLPELRLAAALVSRKRSEGQVCLDLATSSGVSVENEAGVTVTAPSLEKWQTSLGEAPEVVGGPGELKPLVMEGHRLYWRRYWDYEQRLATALQTRVQATPEAVGVSQLREGLKRLFPNGGSDELDWQQVAAFLVVRHRLTVILGGPGTGKTRTVARALALLFALLGPTLRVAVAAPTGKAAARLQATIRRAKSELGADVPALASLSDEVKTVHRLLRVNPVTGRPHFDVTNPLPLDVLVVDEASMVDLALMTKLVSALPASARLVLLGDKDQLAAVEAGSVLGDLAAGRESNRYSTALSAEFAETTGIALPVMDAGASPLADCFVELRANHRFGTDSGIYRASRCVNNGDAAEALGVLRPRTASARPGAGTEGSEGEAVWQELPGRTELRRALREKVLSRFGLMCRANDPSAALLAMETFRILAAVRSGPFGVEGLNLLIVDVLREAGLVAGGPWYSGRQLLVTAIEQSRVGVIGRHQQLAS